MDKDTVLLIPADLLLGRKLLFRVAFMLALVAAVFLALWLDREDLKDHRYGEVSFIDTLYFAMVTITTVGYGDMVPVTPRARLIDAVFVTPMRIIIWVLFLGTAYRLVVRQYMEGCRMVKMQATLHDHVIVCERGRDHCKVLESRRNSRAFRPDHACLSITMGGESRNDKHRRLRNPYNRNCT